MLINTRNIQSGQAGRMKALMVRRTNASRNIYVGVAFLVQTDGLTIYHAGDLSVWNVDEDGNPLYSDIYGGGYKKQMRHLENKHIDLGFVVLDPRMGAGAYAGLDYFVQRIDCDLIFPMHCWEDYSIIKKYKRRPQVARFRDKIVDIDRDNIIFNVD